MAMDQSTLAAALAELHPASGSFYRELLSTRAREDPFVGRRHLFAPPPQEVTAGAAAQAAASPAVGGGGAPQQRTAFGCPCCGRLFHVFVEGGRYRAVAAGGSLRHVRVRYKPDRCGAGDRCPFVLLSLREGARSARWAPPAPYSVCCTF